MFHAEEDADHIDVEDAAKALDRVFRDRRDVTLDAGILLAPFSPWRSSLFDAPYFGPQLVIVIFFAVITAAQVIAWKLSAGSA